MFVSDGYQVLAALFLLLVLFSALVSDLRFRKIPNALILLGWLGAIAWHGIAPSGAWAFDAVQPGSAGILGSLLGLLSLLLGFMPFYALRIMGAGDVKLLSVVGAFFGATGQAWMHLIGVSLCVLVAGGILSLVRMLVSRRSRLVLGNVRTALMGLSVRLMRVPGPTFDPRADSADRMPYAVAIAAGTVFYVVGKWSGWITML